MCFISFVARWISFAVVCFEVATLAVPFKGMDAAQVITGVVLDEKRPQIPEGASASPDVVTLMEKCWQQTPAGRPEGFVAVVRELEGVVSRFGDPRVHSAAAVNFTHSSVAKRDEAPSVNIPTAPLTVSGGVEISPLDSMSVTELKVIANGLGVSTKGCVEKQDVVERIKARGEPRKAKTATKTFNKMFGKKPREKVSIAVVRELYCTSVELVLHFRSGVVQYFAHGLLWAMSAYSRGFAVVVSNLR